MSTKYPVAFTAFIKQLDAVHMNRVVDHVNDKLEQCCKDCVRQVYATAKDLTDQGFRPHAAFLAAYTMKTTEGNA